MTRSALNRRVLLVDDTPAIHEDYRKVLAAFPASDTLAEDEAFLFGGAPAPTVSQSFEISSAFQGAEAVEKVRLARDRREPYAMAFVDIRMPPGWDGIETTERLWREDPELQVVLCTAYSDYSWSTILARLDARDRLLILKKPFDPIEVYQLASALTTKWKLSEQAISEMGRLEAAVEQRTRELSKANIIVQNSPVILYRLAGNPSLSMTYISANVARYGHEAASLVGAPDWARRIICAEDRPKLGELMARIAGPATQPVSMEFRLCTAEGQLRWVESHCVPIRNADGQLIEIEGIVTDIHERKAAEERIALLAHTDALTGLANRTTFVERLQQAFAATRRGGPQFAVLCLDLDGFKQVNDSAGHDAGDELLRQVAARLKGCSREADVIARLGGDEFAVLQSELRGPAAAGELAAKFQRELSRPFALDGYEAAISTSIGICPCSADVPNPDVLLSQADQALYRSKQAGRNRYCFHSVELDREVRERVEIAAELRTAIERSELALEYQAQVELASRRILGMEALVRWRHPTRGLLAPTVFIPIAEQTGTIVPLGRWVLDQACQQMRAWRDAGIAPPVIAVNVSLVQLKRGTEFIDDVTQTLQRWGLATGDLEFDVTERTLAQLKWTQNDVLPRLRELGVKIAIDDFGSEYSSFDYIKAYRVNHLKISRSFISRAETDPQSAATVSAMVKFARDTGIDVIAQGVETRAQAQLLGSTADTMQVQGFHFSAAVDADGATTLLREGIGQR